MYNEQDLEELNQIAQAEFGIKYENLGANEKEWCEDERIYGNTQK